jgi:hypothetical protein
MLLKYLRKDAKPNRTLIKTDYKLNTNYKINHIKTNKYLI